MKILEKIDIVLNELSAADKTHDVLQGVIRFLEDQRVKMKDMKSKSAKENKKMLDMANGMLDFYRKNNGFSKDQAEWIYKMSTAFK